jgi:IclR family pca regulon transcriptional regulator
MAAKSDVSESVRSFARGIQVIQAFGGDKRALTLADLARRTELSRATVRRLLITLQELGYVATDGRQFTLTPRILTLAYPYLSTVAFTDLLLPFMEAAIGTSSYVSSSVAMLDDANVVFVAALPARGIIKTWMTVGLQVPAITAAMGRVLLSRLPAKQLQQVLDVSEYRSFTEFTETNRGRIEEIVAEARLNGFAVCDREMDPGIKACAVPIFDRQGNCWAAMSASCHDPQRSLEDFVAEFVPTLQEASRRFSSSMPYDPFGFSASSIAVQPALRRGSSDVT